MTDLQDLERRLRMLNECLYGNAGSAITEAADIIATLMKMGEGLPEPVAYVMAPSKTSPIAMTCPVAKIDQLAEMHNAPLFTREQMISYGLAQREKALEEVTDLCVSAEPFSTDWQLRRSGIIEAINGLKGKQ